MDASTFDEICDLCGGTDSAGSRSLLEPCPGGRTLPRIGDWLQTYTGQCFYPLDPRPIDVDIRDIAHALSLICRFGGHCREFYSVAQHSVLVSYRCGLAGLLHDATEAYLGDMVRPLKCSMPEYKRAEEHLERVIFDAFGLSWPLSQAVKDADAALLLAEKRDLLLHDLPWGYRPGVAPYVDRIVPWDPQRAEREFLSRYGEVLR